MIEAVRDNPALSRFELAVAGIVAIAEYTLAGDVLTFTHTEVPVAARNRGIASRLVEGALRAVRARGLKVVVRCQFVQAYIDKHPEYRDLQA